MAKDADRKYSVWNRSHVPAHASVVLRRRARYMVIRVESLHGLTGFERLVRIPGSQKPVQGLICFEGDIIPLLSFFDESAEQTMQRGKVDSIAVILSVGTSRFALCVDEVPIVCESRASVTDICPEVCHLHRRHLARLFELCSSGSCTSAENVESPCAWRENGSYRFAPGEHGTRESSSQCETEISDNEHMIPEGMGNRTEDSPSVPADSRCAWSRRV